MSTCQGAPAPHDGCPHGDACDWQAWPEPDQAFATRSPAAPAGFMQRYGRTPANRQERRLASRLELRVATRPPVPAPH